MTGYGQYCPVAKTMEVLDERWTILIIRELLAGSHYFNDLRRGVPKMSPALLSKRLRSLARAGLVLRDDSGNRIRYELTPGGRELAPVIMAIGNWGMHWMTQLGEGDLDPHLLMWDIHRNIDLDAVPDSRTVLCFHFTDVEPRSATWWVVIEGGTVTDLCDADPGYEVLITTNSTLLTLVRIWRGDVTWNSAVRAGELTFAGNSEARRALPQWLKLSVFAPATRPPLVG
ncbi:winged helix-turn-helix transcriptional regulator [Arthrobacter castelli]|uniref:winged helix-turn-helix transcriptional regulator n=1 Tax=Arthrobacter castelli TaxID=271431 RepID=UPI00040CB36B|nr:helix-turn-helix domain-containing protein [Arthrobacter castelli]